jgi:hypothetical protein
MPACSEWGHDKHFVAEGNGDRKMSKSLDFVFVGMPVEKAELEWCDFLTNRKEVPASHQVAFIPSSAGSFLVNNNIRNSGAVPGLRRRWTERGIPTAKLLHDFENWESLPSPPWRYLKQQQMEEKNSVATTTGTSQARDCRSTPSSGRRRAAIHTKFVDELRQCVND